MAKFSRKNDKNGSSIDLVKNPPVMLAGLIWA
jgi:hypothetical protein